MPAVAWRAATAATGRYRCGTRRERRAGFGTSAAFEMGLLSADDWKGTWLTGGNLFRTELVLPEKIGRARAYVCGLGLYELRINGSKVGNHVLDPGWTDYDQRMLYATYDIADHLARGANAVAVMLGNGRYSPPDVTLQESSITRRKYGVSPILLLQLRIDFTDGSSLSVATDETSWRTTRGPITRDDIYAGETYDARLETTGSDSPGFDCSAWDVPTTADPPSGALCSQASCPAIAVVERLWPRAVANPQAGVHVFDFGQNIAGWVQLRVAGAAGSKVTLRHAKLVHDSGMINTASNQGADACLELTPSDRAWDADPAWDSSASRSPSSLAWCSGEVAGYFGGTCDALVMRTVDLFISIPRIPLWMALAAAVPRDWPVTRTCFAITVVLSIVGWTNLARVVRGELLVLREEDFVMAAKISGATGGSIIGRHLLPSFFSYLIVNLTLAVPEMIIGETALSFLGLGLQPPAVSWGT